VAARWALLFSYVFATAGFAAVSGASPVATAAVFARIAIRKCLAIAITRKFAAGVVAQGGTIGVADPRLRSSLILRSSFEQTLANCFWRFLSPVNFGLVYAILQSLASPPSGKTSVPPVTGFYGGNSVSLAFPAAMHDLWR